MPLLVWLTGVSRQTILLIRRYEWPIVGLVALGALALGFAGFTRADPSQSVLDALYRDVQLLVLQSGHLEGDPVPWELQMARFLVPAIGAYVGLKALAALFQEQAGLLLAHVLPPSVVVCGLGERGFLIARSLRERGERVLVIEKDGANELIGTCRRSGALVLVGDATDPEVLRAARVHRAKHVMCVCREDLTNAEMAVRTRELALREGSQGLTCNVHVVNPQLYSMMKAYGLGEHWETDFRLDCFNVFEVGARALIREHPPPQALSAVGAKAHLMVVGLGRLGESLIVHAARYWGRSRPAADVSLRITVLDREAERKIAAMLVRYPQLGRACDLVPYQIDFTSPDFERADFLFDTSGGCSLSQVYVCLADSSLGATLALKLHQRLRGYGVPIVVRLLRSGGLATLLQQETAPSGVFETLHSFALLDQLCDPDLVLGGTFEAIARAIHEEYVRGQEEQGQTPQTNPSMVPWEELPETLKESNRAQARHIGVKLKEAGCTIAPLMDWDAGQFQFAPEQVECLAEMEHDRWKEERRRQGWLPGPRDIDKKTSPYMVPWHELSDEVKEWDRATIRGLPAFLARVDLQVVRLGGMHDDANTT